MTTERKEKFTPGPWEYHKSARLSPVFNIWAGAALLGEVVREPNARMMAAAPEMYEALVAIESCLSPDNNDHAAQRVRAAIAKARGGQ